MAFIVILWDSWVHFNVAMNEEWVYLFSVRSNKVFDIAICSIYIVKIHKSLWRPNCVHFAREKKRRNFYFTMHSFDAIVGASSPSPSSWLLLLLFLSSVIINSSHREHIKWVCMHLWENYNCFLLSLCREQKEQVDSFPWFYLGSFSVGIKPKITIYETRTHQKPYD